VSDRSKSAHRARQGVEPETGLQAIFRMHREFDATDGGLVQDFGCENRAENQSHRNVIKRARWSGRIRA
jgi:hypothetical protein